MLALVLVSCRAGSGLDVTPERSLLASPSETVSVVEIPTAEPRSGTPGPCPAALLTGHLIADSEWGIALLASNGRRTKLIFPYGYGARIEGGLIALVDDKGAVVAQQGNAVSVSGGYVDVEEQQWSACGGLTVTG